MLRYRIGALISALLFGWLPPEMAVMTIDPTPGDGTEGSSAARPATRRPRRRQGRRGHRIHHSQRPSHRP
jgi:hypothetical protein